MTIALISDIHANLRALEVVLDDICTRRVDGIYCLGDVVDYGPKPVECLKLVDMYCGKRRILGNHDLAVSGIDRHSQVDTHWHAATEWTAKTLGEEATYNLCNNKPLSDNTLRVGETRITVAHAWPVVKPSYLYEETIPYVYSGTKKHPETHELLQIAYAMADKNVDIAAYGHTHIPFIYQLKPGVVSLPFMDRLSQYKLLKGLVNTSKLEKHGRGVREYTMPIVKGERIIINVPSVGQPRDNNPHTGYALIDDKNVTIVRLPYDIKGMIDDMNAAGMPLVPERMLLLQNFLRFGDTMPTQSQRKQAPPSA